VEPEEHIDDFDDLDESLETDSVSHSDSGADSAAGGEDADLTPSRQVDKLKRTTGGAVFAAGMLGLQQVLDPKKKEDPPIAVEAPGEPPGPPGMNVDFDPDDPAGSTVTFTEE
jgi:hypothetical protein